jgi:hypothetical protein
MIAPRVPAAIPESDDVLPVAWLVGGMMKEVEVPVLVVVVGLGQTVPASWQQVAVELVLQ